MSETIPVLVKLQTNWRINVVAQIDPSIIDSFPDFLASIYTALRPKIPSGYFNDVEEYRINPTQVIVIWDNPRNILPATSEVTEADWKGVLDLIKIRNGVDLLAVSIIDVNKLVEGEE
jgi:hypothetical protein